MVQSFTAELERLLRAAGCALVRQGRGDHEIWHSPLTGVHFVVDGTIKLRHTANAVLRQAGLSKHL